MEGLLSKVKKREMVIIRHGQTELNKKDEIRGWLDVPLDAVGFEQADVLGKKLKNSDIDILITSDLTRALQTSLCVSQVSGIPIIATTISLRPWNVGIYTGKKASVAHPILYKMAMEEPDKQVEDGESFDSFRCRVLIGMLGFMNEYANKKIGFVTHHRIDRLVRGWYEAGCPSDLEIDFEHFGQHGIEPGTHDDLTITSPLLI